MQKKIDELTKLMKVKAWNSCKIIHAPLTYKINSLILLEKHYEKFYAHAWEHNQALCKFLLVPYAERKLK